jgi:ribosomal protection tetracycline resistance protein
MEDSAAKQRIVIDGYNLIYQFPELRRMLERDREGARKGLLVRLGSYAQEKNIQVVVVFDGDDRMIRNPESYSGIRVVFSKLPEKADPVIKKMIEEHQQGDLTVVSSDQEIAGYAQLYGIKAVSSRQFAHKILKERIHEAEKKFDHSLSPEELEEWLHIFRRNDPTQDTENDS